MRLDNIDYNDGDIIFICKDNLYNIEFRYNNPTKELVDADTWDWTNCDCFDDNPQNAKATLSLSEDKKVKIEFEENDQKYKLNFKFKLVKRDSSFNCV
jgi:TPP-dependent 2-oxoacid decarboxylase